jgi:gas vesicle protein
MSDNPDDIRRQIEATRADLSDDVNALTDKVSPAQIARRQREKLRDTAVSVKERVMGTADSASSSASNAMHSMGGAVSDVPNKVTDSAKGNPLAAGLVAFGTGLLLSSLFPASRQEAKAAAALKEQAQPLVSEVTSAAKELAGNLQEPAQEALESVKSTATEAVETVKEEGATAASDVKDQAQEAKETVSQANG